MHALSKLSIASPTLLWNPISVTSRSASISSTISSLENMPLGEGSDSAFESESPSLPSSFCGCREPGDSAGGDGANEDGDSRAGDTEAGVAGSDDVAEAATGCFAIIADFLRITATGPPGSSVADAGAAAAAGGGNGGGGIAEVSEELGGGMKSSTGGGGGGMGESTGGGGGGIESDLEGGGIVSGSAGGGGGIESDLEGGGIVSGSAGGGGGGGIETI